MPRKEAIPLKKRILFFMIAVLFIATLVACSAPNNKTNTLPTAGPSNVPTQSGATVSIENFTFVPASVTIKVGDTVTWTNNDTAAHTVAIDQLNVTSDSLEQGATYSFKFATAGTYNYHCGVHPSMTGTVVVK